MGSRLMIAALATQVGKYENILLAFGALGLPLATKEDVEGEIADVVDLEETDLAAEERDAKAFVEKSIEEVRDLEETDFAAEPRDAEAFIKDAIEKVRNLEPSEFSKIFDDVEDETDLLNLRNTSTD